MTSQFMIHDVDAFKLYPVEHHRYRMDSGEETEYWSRTIDITAENGQHAFSKVLFADSPERLMTDQEKSIHKLRRVGVTLEMA